MLSQPVLLAVVVVLVGVIAGRWLYSKDDKIEQRRKRAIKVAGVYGAAGFVHIEEFLTNYAVGDYSGMACTLDKAYHLLDAPGAAEKALSDLKARIAAAAEPKA